MPLVLALSLALLALGLAENARHQRNLRKIPIRILVNGTRGKSSVTRLVAGMLREAGYRTVAKTTGSEAKVILEDGSEEPVRRRGGAGGGRITEQKALARLAAGRGAEALVVECMAVRPESQLAMGAHLVRPTITVITNARVDHVEEMGPAWEDTAESLALSVPPGGTLVTAEPWFEGAAGRVVVAAGSSVAPEALARLPIPAFADNVALALAVGDELGIDREAALRGMAKARPDAGVAGILKVDGPSFSAIVVNAFAANDLASTELAWREAKPSLPPGLPLIVLYNNRADREYRLGEFAALAGAIGPVLLVAAVGDNARKAARVLARGGAAGSGAARGRAETLAFPPGAGCEELLASLAGRAGGPFVLFGVGNYKGSGEELTDYCKRNGSPVEPGERGRDAS